jgi:putative hydrolase of HD superfamily
LIEEFFKITTNLKKIPRKGWTTKLGISSPESVADHTFSMSTIAMVLADLQKLDTHKVLKMCLIHDIAESITGDLTPEDISKSEKIELENKTINKILSNLPEDLAKNYLAIWNEYNEKTTDEAKLVHEVDKLEMVIQGQINSKQLNEILDKLLQ